jgi:hypothetical protein
MASSGKAEANFPTGNILQDTTKENVIGRYISFKREDMKMLTVQKR